MRFLFIAMISSLLGGCASRSGARVESSQTRAIGETEAVARAEEFIRRNGYVLTADADPARLELERSLTFGTSPEVLLPQRAGTLLPRACGVLAEAVLRFEKGWSVVFCFDPRNLSMREFDPQWNQTIRERARVVVMDPVGGDMFVAHMDFALDAPGAKRLPGRDEFDRLVESAAQQGVGPDARSPAAPARRSTP